MGLEKAAEQEIKLPTFIESWRKQRNSRKTCFIDYMKTLDCVDHNKLWKFLQERGVLDHLTCLLRNLYSSQEATVRTRRGTTDWFKIGKGVQQHYILSPYSFNLCAECVFAC